jgi:hypothetical protein
VLRVGSDPHDMMPPFDPGVASDRLGDFAKAGHPPSVADAQRLTVDTAKLLVVCGALPLIANFFRSTPMGAQCVFLVVNTVRHVKVRAGIESDVVESYRPVTSAKYGTTKWYITDRSRAGSRRTRLPPAL